jgi:hypothetical protein
VSAHSALGLVALNALFLLAGCGILFAIRGWRSWSELVRLGGLAYLLGVAAVGLIETWALVGGTSAHVGVVLAIALGTAAGGFAVGAALGRRPPRALRLAEPRRREPFLWIGVLGAALVGLWLAAILRVAQGQGLSEYDAWAFWTTKAKAIYVFGRLDATVFTTVFNPSYPIFVPALEAMDFHFMGSPDTTLLHVQFWALLAGFVFAVAGLLRPRVSLAILWPFLALLAVLPGVNQQVLAPQGDFALAFFFGAGALCVTLWLLDREPWLLAAAGVLLAAAMSTKREGQLVAAGLLLGAVVASWGRWRRLVPLVATFLLAFATTIPWQQWRAQHHVPGQFEGASLHGLGARADRILPATHSVLQLVFSYDLWLVAVPLGLAAAVLALRRGYRLPALYALTIVFAAAGFVWVLWAVPDFSTEAGSDQNPIRRAASSLVLLTIALGPLLVTQAIARERRAR